MKKLPDAETPTGGRLYGSGYAVTELLALIDKEVDYRIPRCDCDPGSRCAEHRIQANVAYIREKLKTEVVRVFE